MLHVLIRYRSNPGSYPPVGPCLTIDDFNTFFARLRLQKFCRYVRHGFRYPWTENYCFSSCNVWSDRSTKVEYILCEENMGVRPVHMPFLFLRVCPCKKKNQGEKHQEQKKMSTPPFPLKNVGGMHTRSFEKKEGRIVPSCVGGGSEHYYNILQLKLTGV